MLAARKLPNESDLTLGRAANDGRVGFPVGDSQQAKVRRGTLVNGDPQPLVLCVKVLRLSDAPGLIKLLGEATPGRLGSKVVRVGYETLEGRRVVSMSRLVEQAVSGPKNGFSKRSRLVGVSAFGVASKMIALALRGVDDHIRVHFQPRDPQQPIMIGRLLRRSDCQ